jgi:hypothetical protein
MTIYGSCHVQNYHAHLHFQKGAQVSDKGSHVSDKGRIVKKYKVSTNVLIDHALQSHPKDAGDGLNRK